MDIAKFVGLFEAMFPGERRNEPDFSHWDPLVVQELDPCPEVPGMLSVRKQQLLHLGFSLLDEGEAYFEVGTYMGKSLLSAMLRNPVRPVYACDNFSLFEGNALETTQRHLRAHGMAERVVFHDADFVTVFTPEKLPDPIGLYFYGGAHDEESQYQAIRLVEPYLAEVALVLVDDWRFEGDSQSYARAGTLRALDESEHCWELLYELPARFNGDRALWWNGVAVLSFRRR